MLSQPLRQVPVPGKPVDSNYGFSLLLRCSLCFGVEFENSEYAFAQVVILVLTSCECHMVRSATHGRTSRYLPVWRVRCYAGPKNNYGLLSGLLWGIVAFHFGLLGFRGM